MLFSHITQLVVLTVIGQFGSFTATDYMVLEWNGRNPPLAPFESIERRCSAHLLEGGVPTAEGSRLEWLLRRGQARFYQGDNEGAQADFEECCKLSPDDDRVQFELARCLVEMEVSRERGKAMGERLASKPDAAARGHFVVGNYHIMTSDATSAEAAYTKVIDLDPNWTEARLRRASCYYALGKDSECVADMKFVAAWPQCAGFSGSTAKLVLGCSLARLDRNVQAYAVLVDAKFTAPDDPAIHNTLWMLCAWQGKYGHCMDLSAQWVERFPFDAVANRRAALSCASVGDLDSATKYAKKLLAIAPDAPGASAVAARICAQRGEFIEAKAYFYEAGPRRNGVPVLKRDDALRLAFLLGSCPDDRHRDGKLAVRLIDQADPYPSEIVTVIRAVAVAECGDTDKAAEMVGEAIKSLPAESETTDKYEKLKELFASGSPYRHDPRCPEEQLVRIPAAAYIGWRRFDAELER